MTNVGISLSCLVSKIAELRLHHLDFTKGWLGHWLCWHDLFRHIDWWNPPEVEKGCLVGPNSKQNAFFSSFPSTWSSIKEPGWQSKRKRMTSSVVSKSWAPLASLQNVNLTFFFGLYLAKKKIGTFRRISILHGVHGSSKSFCENDKFGPKY